MASFRRTLSPANHDHPSYYQNGSNSNPLSIGSPSHKLLANGKPPRASLSSFLAGLSRYFAGVISPQKHSRRGQSSWKRPFFRCFLFFVIGFLLGMLPFVHIDDIRTSDFSFEIKPPIIHAEPEERASDLLIDKPVYVDLAMLSDIGLNKRLDYRPRKLLIVVTPTYNRPLQAYYINRLGQLLRLINPPVLWIVVETSAQSAETAEILRRTGVLYRHLVCSKNLTNIKDRGVQQRNTALEHIERHKLDGIVYFADDDNIYSLELFEKMREISRFGTWPVGMLAQSKNKAILEGPVCNESHVIGWHTNDKSKRLRRFHVDMSGFAFNSTILWDPNTWKRPFRNPVRQLDTVKEGFQETTFIEQVVADESQMQGIPGGCGRVMNWHLHLKPHRMGYPQGWLVPKHLDIVGTIK